MYKGLLLGYSNDLSKHVCQPDGVNEVEIVEASEVVIVVKKDSVVMEKLGSCSQREGEEEKKKGRG